MRAKLDFQATDERPAGPHLEKENSTKPLPHNHESKDHPASRRPAQSEEYSTLLARATNDAIRIWNVKTGEVSWPQGLEELLGYKPDAATATVRFWQQQIHPDDRSRVARSIHEALSGDAALWSGEYRVRRSDGSCADILERAAITRDQTGAAEQFVASLMDITARKHLHDQMSRAQKMEAFGQLAGGMAHDFNNFLTTILGYSDLLLNELKLRGAVADHVSEIRNAAGRASALTSQLLAFSRRHPAAPRVVEVNSVVTNLERSLLRLLGENIRIVCELHQHRHGAHIQVDPNDLGQVILNLAVNARDAMPRGGQLTLRTSVAQISSETMPGMGYEPLPCGEYVAISVGDTGIGMSEEAKEHLFEPFFTTKHEQVASGLGLATSFGIVRQSGGDLYVNSDATHGTTVTIYLPKVAPPPPPAYKRASAKNLHGGTESILVLEDDVSVRHVSVRVLRSLGYDVIEAAKGDDAQRLISERGDKPVDLLLTDIMMPEMSGRDFAKWLARTSPNTKVIFISGYLDQALQFVQGCDQEIYFLPKPFDPEQLATKVRQALDA